MGFNRTDHGRRPGHKNKETAQLIVRKEESPGNPWKFAGGDYVVIRCQVYHEPVHIRIQRSTSSKYSILVVAVRESGGTYHTVAGSLGGVRYIVYHSVRDHCVGRTPHLGRSLLNITKG